MLFKLLSLVVCLGFFTGMSSASCSDPISCYLSTVVINVPDLSIPVTNTSVLNITNFICKDISVESIPSSYISPTTLKLGIQNAALTCVGDYVYEFFKGVVTAHISETTANMAIDMVNTNNLPTSFNVTSCDVPSISVPITFSGNIGTRILNLLAAALQGFIESEIKTVFCTGLVNYIEVNGTQALVNSVDPALVAIISSPPSKIPMFGSEMVDWQRIDSLIHAPAQCFSSRHPLLIQKIQRPLINYVIDLISHGTGVVVIPLNSTVTIKNSTVKINSLSIYGLDTFKDISLFGSSPVSNVTIVSEIALKNLGVSLNMTYFAPAEQHYEEELVLYAALSDILFEAQTVLAIDKDVIGKLYLNQLTQVGCILPAVEYLSVASLTLHAVVDSIKIEQISGQAAQLEKDVTNLVDNAVELLTEGFGPLLTDLISGIAQGYIRPLINSQIDLSLYEAKKNEICSHHSVTSHESIIWANSSFIKAVDHIVNEVVGAKGLNSIIDCATSGTGVISPSTSLHIGGLDSFSYLAFLQAYPLGSSKPYNLMNRVGLGSCMGSSCNPLSLELTYSPTTNRSHKATGGELEKIIDRDPKTLSMTIDLTNVFVYIDAALQVSADLMSNLLVSSLSTKGCLGATVEALSVGTLSVDISGASLTINKQSPTDVTTYVNAALKILSSPAGLEKINSGIEDKLVLANSSCTGTSPDVLTDDSTNSNNDSSNSGTDYTIPVSILCVMTAVIALAYFFNQYLATNREKKSNKELSEKLLVTEPVHNHSLAVASSGPHKWYEFRKWDWSESLVCHRRLPLWFRIVMIICLLGNLVIYIDSNQEPVSAAAVITIEIGGKSVSIEAFALGLVETANDMWEAGAYPLAIIITATSGGWPYVKVMVLLSSFVLPPDVLPVKTRQTILRVMDFLGKWSLIDCYVMMLFACAFYFQITSIPGIGVFVNVQSHWGFYGYILGILVSLGLGHIVLASHRHVVSPELTKAHLLDGDDEPVESGLSHIYSISESLMPDWCKTQESPLRNSRDSSEEQKEDMIPVKVTYRGTALLIFFMAFTACLVLSGTFIDSYKFIFQGLTGLLLQEKAEVSYSFTSMGFIFPEATGQPQVFGVIWLQACYFIFGLVMPLGTITLCSCIWLAPLSIRHQKQLLVVTEIFNAWSALDVFSISIVAAVAQLPLFSTFFVGDACDGINVILAEYFDQLLGGEDVCFQVKSIFLSGASVLYAAAVFQLVISITSIVVFSQVIEDRSKESARLAKEGKDYLQSSTTLCATGSSISDPSSNSEFKEFSEKEDWVVGGVTGNSSKSPSPKLEEFDQHLLPKKDKKISWFKKFQRFFFRTILDVGLIEVHRLSEEIEEN